MPKTHEDTRQHISFLEYRQIRIVAKLEVALEIVSSESPKFSVWNEQENEVYEELVAARTHLRNVVNKLRDLAMESVIDE